MHRVGTEKANIHLFIFRKSMVSSHMESSSPLKCGGGGGETAYFSRAQILIEGMEVDKVSARCFKEILRKVRKAQSSFFRPWKADFSAKKSPFSTVHAMSLNTGPFHSWKRYWYCASLGGYTVILLTFRRMRIAEIKVVFDLPFSVTMWSCLQGLKFAAIEHIL
jgi:hypothetical protein